MSSENLSISITFLNGRYHGQEWPPSAARLFQALVAGVMTCGDGRYMADVEPALRWLERQRPPRIYASPAEDRQRYRIAVPNNDMDVVAREWARGRPAEPAKIRTMKEVPPKQLVSDGPHVQYLWRVDDAEGAAAMAERLRTTVHCLHTLGWESIWLLPIWEAMICWIISMSQAIRDSHWLFRCQGLSMTYTGPTTASRDVPQEPVSIHIPVPQWCACNPTGAPAM